MKILKRILIFFGIFISYHILFSTFFPVDENNVLQAPDWYTPLGLVFSAVVTFLLTRKHKHLKKELKRKPTAPNTIPYTARKVPASKKKQYELASEILANIETCVKLANKTDRIPLFVEWYDEAVDGFAALTKFHKVSFSDSPALDYFKLQEEFQWHLCDAIVRAKEATISDIRHKYKNSREFQIRVSDSFENDIESIRGRFSKDTDDLATRAIHEVKNIVGIGPLRHVSSSAEDNLAAIDLMEGLEFEHWCAKLLTDIGYSNVNVTQGSGDQGVDVLAQKDGIKYAIQCKCYSSDLGNTPVQEINAGKTIYHCHIGVVMTNRYFTSGAKQAAEATGVLLWDRDWIQGALALRNSITPHQVPSAPCNTERCEQDYTNLSDEDILPAAVGVILETGQASVSTLQRRMHLGYAKAARVIDLMEERGIVGPFRGSKPRAILITKTQWEVMQTHASDPLFYTPTIK